MAGGGRDSINFIKQDVPKFIQDFKKKTNQSELEDTIDSKKQNNLTEDEDKEREDEAPVVCLTKDVSEEEAGKFIEKSYGKTEKNRIEKPIVKNKRAHEDDQKQEEEENVSGKVVFKKPEKSKDSGKPKSKMKKVSNSNLLSFGEDDEEDG